MEEPREIRLVPWQGPRRPAPVENVVEARELLESIMILLDEIEGWEHERLAPHLHKLVEAEDALCRIIEVRECDYVVGQWAIPCLRDAMPGSPRCSRHQDS